LLAPYCGAADLNGRIVITRRITKKRITLPAYQLRGVSSLPPDSAGPIIEYRNIVVFLEDDLADSGKEEPIRAELVQRNRRFEPQIVVIPVGSTVSFPNEDPIFHNVFSDSDAKKFDLDLYKGNPPDKRVVFNRAGKVDVYCSIHADMHCIVLVMENPYFAVTDANGNYSITNIPPGTYKIKAWHDRLPADEREITVPANGAVKADFTLTIKNLPQP